MPLNVLITEIGIRVKTIRELRKMSQKILAGKIDRDERTIQRIENAEEPTCLQTLNDIANILKVDIDMFIAPSEKIIDKEIILPFTKEECEVSQIL